ncbi:hypothetical protein [Methylomonas rivi]|uniref:Uncharacterized protein n=1 Tax=Methylomonas rivi TaxID=2952226 RepID=A0ABT1U429_9GAMM|nr:hypothetical protein [Methylomonas sp. WSC-6]MCQ8128609.1 hypothetical protein [Methylomonas sp. WSC-6]
MKLSTSWKSAILLTGLAFAPLVSAITPAEETEKKCVKPKFRDFSPAPNSEVKPETEISFHINRNADPLHIGASAKKIPLKVEIDDKKTFYYVTAKLPAELRDGYARIHIEAKAAEGDCIGQDGWLVKISENAAAPKIEREQNGQDSSLSSAENEN